MKKITYIFAVFVLSMVVVACGRDKSMTSSPDGSAPISEDNIDTSKLRDISESTAVPDDILAAVSTGAEQQMLTGFDETVGAVALRKVDEGKIYVVVTASLGSLPESDKYNVVLKSDKLSTAIGSLTKVGENQYQLKYVGTSDLAGQNSIEVVQVSNKKLIFTGSF